MQWVHRLRSAEKAALQLCKMREPDWCMLLILTEFKSIHQSDNSCKAAFPAERSHWPHSADSTAK